MLPLSSFKGNIEYVISDVDDTITSHGLLLPCALEAMYRLKESGRKLILLTGGSAGWADIYARQWPVDLVITESGALAIRRDECGRTHYSTNPAIPKDVEERRKALIGRIGPDMLSSDQYCRLCDIAVDLAKVSHDKLEAIKKTAREMGASLSQSSIHLNIWFGDYDKPRGLAHFFPQSVEKEKCAYIGDSKGDEAMFALFPFSFGVASVKRSEDIFTHLPTYISKRDGGEGFAEIIDAIIGK